MDFVIGTLPRNRELFIWPSFGVYLAWWLGSQPVSCDSNPKTSWHGQAVATSIERAWRLLL
jgi:hypothetical protein